jgi:signal transduction histidine kinase
MAITGTHTGTHAQGAAHAADCKGARAGADARPPSPPIAARRFGVPIAIVSIVDHEPRRRGGRRRGDIPTTRIQPIGLIVNELVTNAAKHGTGTIAVAYRVRESTRELTVCDEGEGVPLGFDPEANGPGLGMKVVNSLARQLGWRLTATPGRDGQGCCFRAGPPLSLFRPPRAWAR